MARAPGRIPLELDGIKTTCLSPYISLYLPIAPCISLYLPLELDGMAIKGKVNARVRGFRFVFGFVFVFVFGFGFGFGLMLGSGARFSVRIVVRVIRAS